ncbi:MAG: NADH-quinone oxidoreductase subunit NuoE [Deltaproteobacteria bacterium]|nr:NADH-quinone oxidoreductase subunit NuoE [Deltaproteobacteria bacterium]
MQSTVPAKFSEETLLRINEILARYATKRAAALPVLYLAQKEFGCINDAALDAVSRVLEISRADIYSLATFYSMFHQEPLGRNVIFLCDNLACTLLGAESLRDYLERKLDVRMGETTDDGRFTLKNAECLGACGQAPVMLVNDDFYEGLTEARIDEVLEKYK